MMNPSKPLVATVYNPHELGKEQLIESFVVRRNVFKQLFREIKASKMEHPEQHFLIEGQRGTGKTTLLLRLSYEVENDAALNTWLIPVVLKEEVYYRVTHLFNLWEEVAQILGEKDLVFSELSSQIETAYDESQDYERACFELLRNALEKHGKKIILFIDNLGEMFRHFNEMESHRLREVLIDCPHLRVIGASSVVLEAFFEYGHAFYEFFKTVQLESLNKEETWMLLLELAKTHGAEGAIQHIIEHHPGRIETLRILTGGVIRTIVLLFEIFVDDTDGNSISDLDGVLDRVTPLYKHRMDDLSENRNDDLGPLLQNVVNAIALNWDSIGREEIARKARLKTDEVKIVLNELEKAYIIQRAPTDTRRNLYHLKERFFNIWYLMRLAPKRSQTKVLWLVRFLECWYDRDELTQRAKTHIQAIRTGGYAPKAAYYLTEALAGTGQLDMETEHEMKAEARKLLEEKDRNLAVDLSPSDKEVFEKGQKYYRDKEYEKAVNLFLQINNKNASIYSQLGYAFDELKDYPKAEKYYLMAAEQGSAAAMYNLGLLYATQLKDYPKAEEYSLMAAEQGNAAAMNGLAWVYFVQKIKKQSALKYAQQWTEADENPHGRHTLACIYLWNNQIEKALQTAEGFIYDKELYEEQDMILYFMLLLAKKQYHHVTAYFDTLKIDLKERFKPLYYALLYFSSDKDYSKMPPELSEPVAEIIKEIKQMAVDYA